VRFTVHKNIKKKMPKSLQWECQWADKEWKSIQQYSNHIYQMYSLLFYISHWFWYFHYCKYKYLVARPITLQIYCTVRSYFNCISL